MAVLTDLQRSIESLHDVQSNLDVSEYVVDDDMRRDIPGAREGLPEQLFVSTYEGAVEMALYVAPSIVAQLESDPPHARLHAGNLESFCIALEGVSHFVMVAWRAQTQSDGKCARARNSSRGRQVCRRLVHAGRAARPG